MKYVGDVRNDSFGNCVKYCIYVVMNNSKKKKKKEYIIEKVCFLKVIKEM